MTEYWNELAKENGFAGILCLSKDILYPVKLEKRMKYSPFQMTTPLLFLKYKIKSRIFQKKNEIAIWNYDEVWRDILFEAISYWTFSVFCKEQFFRISIG